MHKHFDAVREKALNAINRAFRSPVPNSETPLPLAKLVRMLCLEDEDEARALVTHFQLSLTADGRSVLLRSSRQLQPTLDDEGSPVHLPLVCSQSIIEAKRAGVRMVDLIDRKSVV